MEFFLCLTILYTFIYEVYIYSDMFLDWLAGNRRVRVGSMEAFLQFCE